MTAALGKTPKETATVEKKLDVVTVIKKQLHELGEHNKEKKPSVAKTLTTLKLIHSWLP